MSGRELSINHLKTCINVNNSQANRFMHESEPRNSSILFESQLPTKSVRKKY